MAIQDSFNPSNNALEIATAVALSAPSGVQPLQPNDLIRFATGTADVHVRRRCVHALTLSHELRQTALDLRARALRLATDGNAQQASEPVDQEIADVLAERITAQIDVARDLRATAQRSVGDLRAAFGSRVEALRALIAGIQANLQLSYAQPAYAQFRSSAGAASELYDGLRCAPNFELQTDGTLTGHVSFFETDAGAVERLAGKSVVVRLIDSAGDGILLATIPVQSERADFRVEHFSDVTGITSVRDAETVLELVAGTGSPSQIVLMAAVDSRLGSGSRDVIPFQVATPPSILDAELNVALQIDETVRNEFRSAALAAYLPIGSISYLVAEVRISDLESIWQFSVPVAGLSDGTVDSVSFLRLRIQPDNL